MLGLGNTLSGGIAPTRLTNNYSLRFDGVDQAVQIDNVVDAMDVDKGTYSAWIQTGDIDADATVMDAQKDSNNYIKLWWDRSEQQFSITYKRGGNVSRADANTTSSIINDGTWHHLAATWDIQAAGGDGELKIYFDSDLIDGDASTTINQSASMVALDKADIGKSSTNSNYWKGYIDEIAIFDQALGTLLSPAVIPASAIYNSGTPTDLVDENYLIHYWRLETGTGTAATDHTGEGGDGYLENYPDWDSNAP